MSMSATRVQPAIVTRYHLISLHVNLRAEISSHGSSRRRRSRHRALLRNGFSAHNIEILPGIEAAQLIR